MSLRFDNGQTPIHAAAVIGLDECDEIIYAQIFFININYLVR